MMGLVDAIFFLAASRNDVDEAEKKVFDLNGKTIFFVFDLVFLHWDFYRTNEMLGGITRKL